MGERGIRAEETKFTDVGGRSNLVNKAYQNYVCYELESGYKKLAKQQRNTPLKSQSAPPRPA